MQRTSAIQVKTIILTPPMAATMQNGAGQLALTPRKIYTIDAKHFAQRLAGQGLSLHELVRNDLVAYRTHLAETCTLKLPALAMLVQTVNSDFGKSNLCTSAFVRYLGYHLSNKKERWQ